MEEINKIKEEGTEIKNKEGIQKKKRGRKRIKEKVTIKDQKKFFVDYTNEPKKT